MNVQNIQQYNLALYQKVWRETPSLAGWVLFWGYGLFFIALGYGQLQRLTAHSATSLYLHDLIMIFIIILYGITQPQKLLTCFYDYTRRIPLAGWVLLSWILTGTVVTQLHTPDTTQLLYLSRLAVYIGFCILTWHIFCSAKQIFYWLIMSSMSLHLILGIVQYVSMPDTRILKQLGWDDHYYRLIGPLFDPNFTGLVLVITSIAILYGLQYMKRNQAVVLSILTHMGLALTFSRASYLSWLVSMLMLIGVTWWQRRRFPALVATYIVVGGISIAVTLLLAPKPGGEGVNLRRTASIEARVQSAETQLNYTLNSRTVLMGEGLFATTKLGTQHAIPRGRLADNIFVFILQGIGIVGLLITLYVTIRYLIWPNRNSAVTLALIAAVGIHTQFNNSLLQPFLFLYITSLYLLLKSAHQE